MWVMPEPDQRSRSFLLSEQHYALPERILLHPPY